MTRASFTIPKDRADLTALTEVPSPYQGSCLEDKKLPVKQLSVWLMNFEFENVGAASVVSEIRVALLI